MRPQKLVTSNENNRLHITFMQAHSYTILYKLPYYDILRLQYHTPALMTLSVHEGWVRNRYCIGMTDTKGCLLTYVSMKGQICSIPANENNTYKSSNILKIFQQWFKFDDGQEPISISVKSFENCYTFFS